MCNKNVAFLQPGWEERTHTDGRIFFINHSMYNVAFFPTHNFTCERYLN